MANRENKIMKFTKRDLVMVALGLVIYVADNGTDFWVARNYFCMGQYLWGTLTLVTILLSSVTVQFFSYTWFKDDNVGNLNCLCLLHLLQYGMLVRYWLALKCGYQAAFTRASSGDELTIHKSAIDSMADISMLSLFRTFLESTPQLIIQIYILMTSDESAFSQYVSISVSFISISCSTVNYQIALRKSLPNKKKFTGVYCKIIYFFYKMLTLTSWILSIMLVAVLSTNISIILVVCFWFGGLCWTLKQHTAFCKSKATEIVYRIIVGIILIFTFFNVKGEKTKIPTLVYYSTHALITLAIVFYYIFCKPFINERMHISFLISVVVITLILGIIFLIVYYMFFHPNSKYTQDVVDGIQTERKETCRIKAFIME